MAACAGVTCTPASQARSAASGPRISPAAIARARQQPASQRARKVQDHGLCPLGAIGSSIPPRGSHAWVLECLAGEDGAAGPTSGMTARFGLPAVFAAFGGLLVLFLALPL